MENLIFFNIFLPKHFHKKNLYFFVLECQSMRCILSNIIAVTKHKNDIDVVQCHETIVIAIDGALCCRFSSISFSLEWCVQLQWSPHWAHVTFTQLRSNLSQMHSRLVIRILNSVANSKYYHSNAQLLWRSFCDNGWRLFCFYAQSPILYLRGYIHNFVWLKKFKLATLIQKSYDKGKDRPFDEKSVKYFYLIFNKLLWNCENE